MGNIILVAETGADIPPGEAERHGVHIVPMHVSFGSETRDDGTFPQKKSAPTMNEQRNCQKPVEAHRRTFKPSLTASTSAGRRRRSCIWLIPPQLPAPFKAPRLQRKGGTM